MPDSKDANYYMSCKLLIIIAFLLILLSTIMFISIFIVRDNCIIHKLAMIIYKNKNILSYRDISIIIFSLIVIFVYISVCTALTIIIINDDGGVKINEEHNLFGIEYLSCDAYKVNKTLSLNPSVAENFTQMKIRYTSDVKIHATSLKSIFRKEIDSVLNLNVPRLVSMRKAAKMQVVAYSKKKGKLTPSQKIYRIKANKTPEEGLLTSFYDISDYFFERLA